MTLNADAVWAILVHGCGAPSHLRPDFEHWWQGDGAEYRFQGRLGFGGKLWRRAEGFHVTCYPEDLTEARAELMRKANQALAKITTRLGPPAAEGATT